MMRREKEGSLKGGGGKRELEEEWNNGSFLFQSASEDQSRVARCAMSEENKAPKNKSNGNGDNVEKTFLLLTSGRLD